uniref:Chloroplast envelope membrane protein n=1 Tax=Lygus hesperus TaxID=30085 RepID=A0A0A9X9P5_LYGHE
MEAYRDRYTSLIAKKERYERSLEEDDKLSVVSSRSSASVHKKCNLKLPKLVPRQFSRQIKDWISFWATFKRIHESSDFDDEEKFQYLLLYTAEKSPARDLIESFPPSAGNYSKAIEQLKARFGREDLLIELYVRELLSLVLVKAKGGKFGSLRSLYDSLTTQLRVLVGTLALY